VRLAPAWLEDVEGFCYKAVLPVDMRPGDASDDPYRSSLDLLEDGKGLGPPHSSHDQVRSLGGGCYSHWHNVIYFSTSDNSDPRSNGRDYSVYLPGAAADQKSRAAGIIAALPDGFSSSDAYGAVERCLALLYPEAKIGEDSKSYWQDRQFLDAYRALCGENYRSLERKYTVSSFVGLVKNARGDWAECGVYNGSTAYFMALANEATGASRQLYLYDSFEGLSAPGPLDGSYWYAGALTISEDAVRRNLSQFSNIHIRRGWIPERFGEVADRTFSFVHIDVDVYQPTRDSIEFFYPRLARGGILLCDDYGFDTCPGARRAMDDFFRGRPEQVVSLPTGQGFILKT
jgi:hypothetical protein